MASPIEEEFRAATQRFEQLLRKIRRDPLRAHFDEERIAEMMGRANVRREQANAVASRWLIREPDNIQEINYERNRLHMAQLNTEQFLRDERRRRLGDLNRARRPAGLSDDDSGSEDEYFTPGELLAFHEQLEASSAIKRVTTKPIPLEQNPVAEPVPEVDGEVLVLHVEEGDKMEIAGATITEPLQERQVQSAVVAASTDQPIQWHQEVATNDEDRSSASTGAIPKRAPQPVEMMTDQEEDWDAENWAVQTTKKKPKSIEQKKVQPTTTSARAHSRVATPEQGRTRRYCFACQRSDHHWPHRCQGLLYLCVPARRAVVNTRGACRNCLKTTHETEQCLSVLDGQKEGCHNCNGALHNSILCERSGQNN